jgi:polar amino acid transport system substrate-binding protein
MKEPTMKKLPRFLRALPGATMFVLWLCLSSLSHGAGPVLDRVVEQGVLKVAMSGNQQPFNFVYGKNKSVIGFDVDLARELAGLMKVKLEVVKMPFDELLGAVEAGRADMVISGMTITAARTRNVSFIGPYMLSGKSMLASARVMGQLKTREGFNSPDIKLVALKGSTSESLIQQQLPKTALTTVAAYEEGLQILLTGEADGMVADMPILALARQQHRDANLQLMTPPLSIEPLGIVIARGDEQFENLLRNYMSVFEKTGLFLSLHKKWFEIGHSNPYAP